nr:HAMP domain-containing sensor histidine kinase [Pseudonocardia acaciae]
MVMLAVLFVLVGGFSLIFLREYLYEHLDEQLVAAAKRASSSYSREHHDDRDAVPGFLNASGQAMGTLSARIVDRKVRQFGVLKADGATRVVGEDEDDALLDAPPDGDPHTRHVGRLGAYRLIVDEHSDGVTLVTGLPLSEVDAVVTRLTKIVLVAAAGGLVVAGVASALIVRFTLRPLRRVAATASQVTERRLDRGEVALAERVAPADTDPRTEVGAVGAALNRMLDHVASALNARQASETQLRQFIADASHELRTPLAAIRGYAELTRRSGEDNMPPDVAHALRRITSQAERMTSLVEDMLLLARLDAGRPLAREPVDVSQLVVDAVSDAHAAGPDHRWMLRVPEEPVTVTGDAARLSQVLANLLTNARVHTPPGTTVYSELVGSPAEVWLRISDDGPGIPRELVPHVFGRFARGDSSRSRAAGSTGLGLAIVYGVVAAHGGRVGVQSVPGRTVFTVRLPVNGFGPVPGGPPTAPGVRPVVGPRPVAGPRPASGPQPASGPRPGLGPPAGRPLPGPGAPENA